MKSCASWWRSTSWARSRRSRASSMCRRPRLPARCSASSRSLACRFSIAARTRSSSARRAGWRPRARAACWPRSTRASRKCRRTTGACAPSRWSRARRPRSGCSRRVLVGFIPGWGSRRAWRTSRRSSAILPPAAATLPCCRTVRTRARGSRAPILWTSGFLSACRATMPSPAARA